MIEGQPVITHFTNDTLARRGGAQVGDVILSVDGEDAHARMRRLAHYISASNPQSLGRFAAFRMTRGVAGTTVRLRVRRPGAAGDGVNDVARESPVAGAELHDRQGEPVWRARRARSCPASSEKRAPRSSRRSAATAIRGS